MTLDKCNLIGWPSTLNSSSRKGPMLVTVEAKNSAWQSWSLTSRKPSDSSRAERRAVDGPISARNKSAGEFLQPCLSCIWGGSPAAAQTKMRIIYLYPVYTRKHEQHSSLFKVNCILFTISLHEIMNFFFDKNKNAKIEENPNVLSVIFNTHSII